MTTNTTSYSDSIPSLLSWHALRRITIWYFILAAVTGLMYRLSMAGWNPLHFNLSFLRHAHSHLMFFGWAAPAPMIYIGKHLQSTSKQLLFAMRFAIALMLLAGLCSYPFFMFYGYHPVLLGTVHLPLAAIFSGLVMLCWYLFIGVYLAHRQQLPDQFSTTCFDTSLFLLFLASLGAWGVSVVQALNLQNPFWGKGLTHLFLTAFTEGWVILSILGILYAEFKIEVGTLTKNWLIPSFLVGIPLLFPFGMSTTLISDLLLLLARIGGILVGGVLLYHIRIIWKNKKLEAISMWCFPLFLLLIKIVLQLGASILPANLWVGQHGLRIFYLHIILLGFATPSLLNSYRGSISYVGWQKKSMEIAIGVLLLTLLPLTPVWPVSLSGSWVYISLCVGATLPTASMLILLLPSAPFRSSNSAF